MVKDKITISIDRELRKKIDNLRGNTKRSTFIEDVLKKGLLLKSELSVEVSRST